MKDATSYLCVAVWCALTAILFFTRGWIWLGVPPIGPERPPYSDAAAQLMAGDACMGGAGRWYEDACFLPDRETETHSQTYEPWLSFNVLGLTEAHYVATGWVLVVLFYITVGAVFAPQSHREGLLLSAIVLTPAIQLAIERANFDLLISSMLFWASVLMAAKGVRQNVFGLLTLAASIALKLYTGIAAAAFAVLLAKKNRVAAAVGVAGVVIAIAVVGPTTIAMLGQGAPEGHTVFSTGAHWLLRQGKGNLFVPAMLIGVTAFAYTLAKLRYWGNDFDGHIDTTTGCLFLTSWLTAIPLFFLKDSYDYRFTLWLPMFVLLFNLARNQAKSPVSRWSSSVISAFIVLLTIPGVLFWLPRWFPKPHGVSAWFADVASSVRQLGIWYLVGVLSAVACRIMPTLVARYRYERCHAIT